MATAIADRKRSTTTFMPREHGATAMLLTPFVAALILLRRPYWPVLPALAAIVAALTIKDPLVVLARQRFVWKQEHAETREARRSAAVLGVILVACGLALIVARGWYVWIPFISGSAGFAILAVAVNVRNKQRSEWFQVASAAALSATGLVACVSAIGSVPNWGWLLWILCTLQAAAGIFVVHSRLEARIAARKIANGNTSRRSAFLAQTVLIAVAGWFLVLQRFWIAAALIALAGCYLAELYRQKQPSSLQTPLKLVGLRALAQSIAYTLVLIVGLWNQ